MIQVDQRIIGEMGDCFTASLASLLELPYEDVPYFIGMGDKWHEPFFSFLKEHGYEYHGLQTKERILELSVGIDGYYLVSGESPRGLKAGHAVVYKGLELAHDPHPSRAGIIGEPMFWMIEKARGMV